MVPQQRQRFSASHGQDLYIEPLESQFNSRDDRGRCPIATFNINRYSCGQELADLYCLTALIPSTVWAYVVRPLRHAAGRTNAPRWHIQYPGARLATSAFGLRGLSLWNSHLYSLSEKNRQVDPVRRYRLIENILRPDHMRMKMTFSRHCQHFRTPRVAKFPTSANGDPLVPCRTRNVRGSGQLHSTGTVPCN